MMEQTSKLLKNVPYVRCTITNALFIVFPYKIKLHRDSGWDKKSSVFCFSETSCVTNFNCISCAVRNVLPLIFQLLLNVE